MLRSYDEHKETSIPWTNRVPKSWLIQRGKSIFQNKKQLNTQKQCDNILSLTLKGVVNNSIDNPIGLVPKDYATYQIFEKDDLVFKLIDLENYQTSRVGLVHELGIMSPAYIRIALRKKDDFNIKYFFYQYYDLYLRRVFNQIGAGVRSTLSAKELLNIEILIPPREEQDQIVRFLDWKLAKINKLIRAKKKQIALFNEQRQAIINNAVTKGLDSHAKLKESGISGLGSIPSTWSVKPLKYWAKSNLQSLNSSTEADFEFDYLDISSVGFGYVKQEPVHYRFDEAPSRARRIVKYGDTIISTVRTYLRSMCFIDHDIEHCIVSTGFSVLSPIKETVLPEILSYALSSDYFVNEVIKNSIGVSYPAINDKKLLSLKVALPSTIEEQLQLYNEIKSKTTLLDKGILSIKQQVTTLKEFRTRLISDVVTGKVDVRDIEIPEYEADSDETIDDEIDDNLVLDEEDGEMEVE